MSDMFVNVLRPADLGDDIPNGEPVVDVVRYDTFVGWLFKPDTYAEMLHHAKGGLCEEAGETSGWIKKHLTYGVPLHHTYPDGKTLRDKVKEELGDLQFYARALQNVLGFSMQEVLQANADKLSERYKELRYNQADAIARADKNGQED
jgi:NTP pyrophosphatase (non-canonical NTP hydrolase)